jgi:hypothetical protein
MNNYEELSLKQNALIPAEIDSNLASLIVNVIKVDKLAVEITVTAPSLLPVKTLTIYSRWLTIFL